MQLSELQEKAAGLTQRREKLSDPFTQVTLPADSRETDGYVKPSGVVGLLRSLSCCRGPIGEPQRVPFVLRVG